MMSPSANAAIDWLFEKSLRDTSVLGSDDHCVVTGTGDLSSAVEETHHKLVVLNISSYVFRIVALFDFDTDAATAAYLARMSRSTDPQLKDQALLDAYAEFVNMICGAVNRGLGAAFQVGMSTPFFLESACAGYVSILNPSRVQSFEVVINQAIRFKVKICICVANDTTLDFHLDRSTQDAESSGELELF